MSIARRQLLLGLVAAAAVNAGSRRVFAQAPEQQPGLTRDQQAMIAAAGARTLAALPYKRVQVPGTQALTEWERLRAQVSGWPVVVGDDEALHQIAEQYSIAEESVPGAVMNAEAISPQSILKAAATIRFPEDLQKWSGAYRPEDLRAPIGEWPVPSPAGATDAQTGLTVANDIDGRIVDRVHLLQTPARFGWEVPAYLRWGDWNACPPPEYHIAALRLWHEQFGAELVGIDGATLNIRVRRRPADREQALDLARQFYGYCPDIVDQGTGTLSVLAATLMESDWWFFWWD
jgi:hypothetical protein